MVNSKAMNKKIKLINQTNPLKQPLTATYCESFLCKLKGLSWRKSLPKNEGLLLVQNKDSRMDSSIHMFGMFFDLAIVWINANMQVVDVKPAYRWRSMLLPLKPAKYTLEININRMDEFQTGDQIRYEKINPT